MPRTSQRLYGGVYFRLFHFYKTVKEQASRIHIARKVKPVEFFTKSYIHYNKMIHKYKFFHNNIVFRNASLDVWAVDNYSVTQTA